MGHTVDRVDDYVVDMVVEVDSRGIDVEDLARRICLPGVEVLRTSARGTIWLTSVVTADGEPHAIRQVRDRILGQLRHGPSGSVVAVVTAVALGDLYGRLDEVLGDQELGSIDVRDLIERHMWDRADLPMTQLELRPTRKVDQRTVDQVDLRPARVHSSA